jgi:hypothetical protein
MAAFYVTSDAQGDPFDTRTDLLAGPWYNQGVLRTPTQNDYALVTEDETHDDLTSRYMYDGTQWVWQYTLNNTKFTQAQIDAINSGITSALVSQITTNQNNIGDLNSLTTTAKTDLVSAVNELQSGKQATISDLATIRAGASAGATALQPSALNGYATESWVGQQGFLKNSDLTDYATKTYANEASAAAFSQAQTWVGQQGYLTSIPNTYALKSDVEAASANALSEAKTWVGDQGFLKSTDLTDYATKTYTNEASANALSQAQSWVEQQSYLPTSGGTVSGQLTISGSNFNNNLHLKRGNTEGFIGLANNGAITIKNVIPNSTSQIEFLTSANKTFDITIKDNSTTPQPVGKLYVMSAHSLADAAATSANWANDGMLHIILDS